MSTTTVPATGATVTVRIPVVEPVQPPTAPTYSLRGSVAGRRVGLRTEGQWRSWLIIVREWERILGESSAIPDVIRTGERVGEQGERTRDLVRDWVSRIDCAVVGLGTCGSCTSWSVRDGIAVEEAKKPVIVAVTSEFEVHGRRIAAHLGHGDLRFLVLPYPLETRPEDELVSLAISTFPRAISLLGAVVG
jgi:hypothetical protein